MSLTQWLFLANDGSFDFSFRSLLEGHGFLWNQKWNCPWIRHVIETGNQCKGWINVADGTGLHLISKEILAERGILNCVDYYLG